MIRAACHRADNALALEFDATPWFREADALETRPGYDGLHQLVEYAATRLKSESLEDPTWDALTCVVDASEAQEWLAENRPEIASRLVRQRPAGFASV